MSLFLSFLCTSLLVFAQVTPSYDTVILKQGEQVAQEALIAAAAAADVVLIGEHHDHAEGHAFKAEFLRTLGPRAPRLVLSLEMFERDVQEVLDEYLAGFITENAFLAASRPWPRYRTDYRPLVEWCKENRRPVVAANVPRRYVNMVARMGQQSLLRLPPPSRRWLPRLPYSMDMSPEYHRALDQVFGMSHGTMPETMAAQVNRMKEAQALWDHGMAESILSARRRYRAQPVVHVVGSMHCERGFGIVERLRRAAPRLRVVTVIVRPHPRPEEPAVPSDLGDYVVLTGPPPAATTGPTGTN